MSMLLLAAGLAPGLSHRRPRRPHLGVRGRRARARRRARRQGATLAVRAATVVGDRSGAPVGRAGAIAAVRRGRRARRPRARPRAPAPAGRQRTQLVRHRRRPLAHARRRRRAARASAYLGDGPLDLDNRGQLGDTPDRRRHRRGGRAVARDGAADLRRPAAGYPRPTSPAGSSATARRRRRFRPRATLAAAARHADPARRRRLARAGRSRRDLARTRRRRSTCATTGRVAAATPTAGWSSPRPRDTRRYVVTSDVVPTGRARVRGPEVGADADATGCGRALPPTLPAARRRPRAPDHRRHDRPRRRRPRDRDLPPRRTRCTTSTRRSRPRRADTVDDFLFNSRSGFCEHFASAEVVLLRSLGIPSRLASGFLAGPGRRRRQHGPARLRRARVGRGVDPRQRLGQLRPDRRRRPLADKSRRRTAPARSSSLVDAATGSTHAQGRRSRRSCSSLAVAALARAAPCAAAVARTRRRAGHADARRCSPRSAATRTRSAGPGGRAPPRRASARSRARPDAATTDVVGALLTVERASYAGHAAEPDEDARTAVEVIDRAAARLLADVDA